MPNLAHAHMPTPATATAAVLTSMESFFAQSSPGALSEPFGADTALLSSGLLDSLSMLQLTTHLSDAFGIEFEDEDFTMENFATSGQIAELVAAKLTRSG